MRAGTLRHSIVIEKKTEAQSTSGYPTETWATLATCRARVSPTGGFERWQGATPDTGRLHDIEIRYLSTVDTNMRVVFGSRVFYIKELIDPDERRIRIIMKTEEKLEPAP